MTRKQRKEKFLQSCLAAHRNSVGAGRMRQADRYLKKMIQADRAMDNEERKAKEKAK